MLDFFLTMPSWYYWAALAYLGVGLVLNFTVYPMIYIQDDSVIVIRAWEEFLAEPLWITGLWGRKGLFETSDPLLTAIQLTVKELTNTMSSVCFKDLLPPFNRVYDMVWSELEKMQLKPEKDFGEKVDRHLEKAIFETFKDRPELQDLKASGCLVEVDEVNSILKRRLVLKPDALNIVGLKGAWVAIFLWGPHLILWGGLYLLLAAKKASPSWVKTFLTSPFKSFIPKDYQ